MKNKNKILSIIVASVLCAMLILCTACVPSSRWEVTLDYDTTRGTVELSPMEDDFIYYEGTEITVTVSANPGYVASKIYLDGALKEKQFTFTITSNVRITVEFDLATES